MSTTTNPDRATLSIVESLCREPAPDLGRLHELGRGWALAHHPLAPMLLTAQRVTEQAVIAVLTGSSHTGEMPQLAEKARATGEAATHALLAGFLGACGRDEETPQVAAACRLWGVPTPAGAEAYAVVAAHSGTLDLCTRVDDALKALGRQDVTSLLYRESGYLLAPARVEQHARDLGQRLHDHLGGEPRLAITWCGRHEVAQGREEVQTVLDIVVGLRWAPGVYEVEDVVLEYAVMQDKAAVAALLALIRPVVRQQSLRTSLEALVSANGNRSKAANALRIHRTTLEYRLARVERLTGCPATTMPGLRKLAAALSANDIVHRKRPAAW
ncbi:PucR family transcriptional regulator [Lentzea sp. NPDC004789]